MTREEFEQYAVENGLVVWSDEMSERAIKAMQEPKTDAITIPEGATNGDVLKALFPAQEHQIEYAIEDVLKTATMFVFTEECAFYTSFDLDWWNAPYKESEE